MDAERILTLHPDGKAGVNVERWKYDRTRDAILSVLCEAGECGVRTRNARVSKEPDLYDLAGPRLGPDFEGSRGWYITAVKLDLEARGEIGRIPGVKPQRVRLGEQG